LSFRFVILLFIWRLKMARTTAATGRKSNRRTTFIWIAVVVAIIIGLIWQEQVALLYVLATFSVTALLLVVAFSDLGGSRQPLTIPPPNDDSAAAGDGLSASHSATRTANRR
jgi:peptidoglycan/LPS O-acetylase OafA/YrhL